MDTSVFFILYLCLHCTLEVFFLELFYCSLDDDQCARKNAQRFFDVVDPDYYEFEGKDQF